MNDTLVDLWCDYLRAGNRSGGTISLRRGHVSRCLRELDRPVDEITEDNLVEWIAGNAWSASTRRSVRASLRGFWSWAASRGHCADVAAGLPAAPVPRAVPRPAADQVILDALRAADARVQLMVELMAYGGLRRCEVARTRGDDVTGEWLRVTGKGGHVRMVPLPAHLARRVAAYGDHYVFRGAIDGHLSARRVGELVGEVLPAGVTSHQLRHRFATAVYRGSHDIRAVQSLLGHAKLDTTMIYTAVDPTETRAAAGSAWRLSG
jgi:integrase/recombinase XerC